MQPRRSLPKDLWPNDSTARGGGAYSLALQASNQPRAALAATNQLSTAATQPPSQPLLSVDHSSHIGLNLKGRGKGQRLVPCPRKAFRDQQPGNSAHGSRQRAQSPSHGLLTGDANTVPKHSMLSAGYVIHTTITLRDALMPC